MYPQKPQKHNSPSVRWVKNRYKHWFPILPDSRANKSFPVDVMSVGTVKMGYTCLLYPFYDLNVFRECTNAVNLYYVVTIEVA